MKNLKNLKPFIHPLSDVQTEKIGAETKIWQYVVVLPNATIGCNCNINSHVFIENDVIIGDNVTIKSNIHIWDNIRIGNNVFLGPSVVFTNDLMPRSKRRVPYAPTFVLDGASIGANSTILAGVTIGKYAMVGIGSVVTRNVPDYALAYGNPARIKGWVDKEGNKLASTIDNIWVSRDGQKFIVEENKIKKI